MVLDLLPLLDCSTSCVRNWPSTSAKYMNREYMEFSSVLDNIEMFKCFRVSSISLTEGRPDVLRFDQTC